EAFLTFSLLLLNGFDNVAVCAGCIGSDAVAEGLVVFGDLLTQKALLVGWGHADALKGAVRHNDAVPGATRHFRCQELAPLAGKVLLAGNETPAVLLP